MADLDDEELEELADTIVRMNERLPLAIQVLGELRSLLEKKAWGPQMHMHNGIAYGLSCKPEADDESELDAEIAHAKD